MALGGSAALVLLTVAGAPAPAAAPSAATPLQHIVVIFQENVSFDHYFATYPTATNSDGQHFTAASGTPAADGLTPTGSGVPQPLAHASDLTASNPNGSAPQRLDPAQVNQLITCDQDHGYTAEQTAFDQSKMDKFPTATGTSKGFNFGSAQGPTNEACKSTDVLNYYDGNTVTGLWNYAQHFAMSDNSFGTTFGPSAPGAINLVSGDTGGVSTPIRSGVSSDIAPNGLGGFSMIDDAQPYYDDCSSRDALSLTGKNIGDELNTAGLSWGWFQGGFGATTAYSGPPTAAGSYNPLKVTGGAVCGATHNVGVAVAANVTGSPTVRPDRTDTGAAKGPYGTKADYIPHHEPFQYYASTANPHHIAPASPSAVGTDTQTYTNGKPNFDAANHNYDVSDFDNLVSMITAGQLPASQLPAVSFLKAPGYEDGHAGYSDPYDEQAFVTKEVSALEHSPDWSSTAIFISYDDSDGWYDHVDASIENGGQPQNASTGAADTLTGAKACGAPSATTTIGKVLGRCGLGPRLPLIAISPYAKVNYVDHNLSDQTSIINLVEYNWHLPSIAGSFDARLASSGRPFDLSGMFDFSAAHANPLFLNSATGQALASTSSSKSSSSSSSNTAAIVVGVIVLVIVLAGGGFVLSRRRTT